MGPYSYAGTRPFSNRLRDLPMYQRSKLPRRHARKRATHLPVHRTVVARCPGQANSRPLQLQNSGSISVWLGATRRPVDDGALRRMELTFAFSAREDRSRWNVTQRDGCRLHGQRDAATVTASAMLGSLRCWKTGNWPLSPIIRRTSSERRRSFHLRPASKMSSCRSEGRRYRRLHPRRESAWRYWPTA